MTQQMKNFLLYLFLFLLYIIGLRGLLVLWSLIYSFYIILPPDSGVAIATCNALVENLAAIPCIVQNNPSVFLSIFVFVLPIWLVLQYARTGSKKALVGFILFFTPFLLLVASVFWLLLFVVPELRDAQGKFF